MSSQQKLGFTLSYDFLPPSLCHDLITVLNNTNFTHLFIPEAWGNSPDLAFIVVNIIIIVIVIIVIAYWGPKDLAQEQKRIGIHLN